jgi:hypothetical protein
MIGRAFFCWIFRMGGMVLGVAKVGESSNLVQKPKLRTLAPFS